MDDVARNAGLSSMTVSRALNTPQLVRPATL
ncbi:LacI family DNA-binding transcriptional regulator, partial [Escherichia fergusonii]